jgi:hypothetical protein
MAREQRKLAAIVAADVVGYSRLMGRDESGTLARLAAAAASRVLPLSACPSYSALANARQARFTRRPWSVQGQSNERESTAARGANSGSPSSCRRSACAKITDD